MTWPFENNTNAITGKLAKRSLQADKRRNIFLIVTITLTTALLSGIFFTVFAEQRKMLSDLRGQYQTVVMETTQKEIEHLSTQPEIEQWGLSKDFGSARYQDSTLAVEYADKGWMKLGKRPSYVGNFPEKEQEIIVEQAFLDYFGLPQEIGQTIRLNLGNGDQDYIISGILQKENNSRMFSVIVSKAFLEAQAKGEPLYEFRFRFVDADRTDMDALKSDIAAFLADHNIPENRIFYSSNYFDIRSFQSDGVYACIPIALIFLAACGLVIYSIFFISIRGKLREYGRLKVLGTTPKQIRKIIHRESFRLSICSIPIGIAIGGAAGFAASPGYWDWTENIIIALGVMFFIEFIVRISSYAPIRLAAKVSPIEAVRASGYQAEGSKKTSRKSGKHLSPNYLAVMNFRRNPKKAVLTLLSLGMAGVFLFSTATVVHSVNAKNMAAVQMYEKCNYTIQWEADLEEFPEISRNNPLTPELKEKILAVDGVKSINSRASSSAFVSLPNGAAADFYLHTFTREEEQELLSPEMVLEGTADYDELVKNHGIVITDDLEKPLSAMYSGYQPKIGDTLTFQPYGGEPMEFTVMGIANGENITKTTGIGLFSVPEDLAKQLYPDIKNMEQVWNVFTDEDTDTLRKELYALLDDPLLNIISRSDYAEQLEAQFKNIMMFIYGLLAFLFFFSLVNLINTLMTNLIARQQEFGILQSVGLSDKQLSKMLTMECFCYVAVTLLITLIVGGLAGFLLVIILGKTEIFGQLVYQFPIWELLVFATLLMFVQALYSIYAIRSIRKQSLVERIKITD